MKTAHEENLESLEAEILALRERMQLTELMLIYPPSGATERNWRICKTDELERLKAELSAKEAKLFDWAEQLKLPL